jgi:hypothetical protein
MFHEAVKKSELSACMIIIFQVMAFSGMSAGHPDTVSPLPQSGKGKFRTHSSGAGNPDDPNIRWILHPAYTGQICRTVTAPVA